MSVPWELRPFFTPEIDAVPVQNLVVSLFIFISLLWERLMSVSEVQSSVAIVDYLFLNRFFFIQSKDYLPLASIKVECVSLTRGQVRGHLDSAGSELVS